MSAQFSTDIDFDRSDPLYQVRRQFLLAQSLIGIIVSLIGLVGTFVLINTGRTDVGTVRTLFLSVLLIASIFARLLVISERPGLAAASLILVYLVGMIVSSQVNREIPMVLAALALVTASSLRSWWAFYAVNAVVFGWMIYQVLGALKDVPSNEIIDQLRFFSYPVVLAVISIATRYFIRSTETVSKVTVRAASLMYAAVDVGQITAKFLTFEELFNRTVELVRDRFGYSHAQIFLVDGRYAQLVASTGVDGLSDMKIEVGSQTLVGRVTQIGEVTSINRYRQSGTYAENVMFKDMKAELTLPILDGDHIIGALDVQDKDLETFSMIDIQALQVVTGQLSAAIRNARLFEEQQTSIDENQRLYSEAQKNLNEIQRLNRMLTKSGWDDYIQHQREALGVTLGDGEVTLDAQWTPLMVEATQDQNPVLEAGDEENVTAVPIVLRGEVLGAIEVVADKDAANKGELLEMVQSVANQLAVSLENVRLFEEAQESAVREQRINKIVQLYQSADTVDELLKITLQELSQTFDAEQATIRMGTLPEDSNGKLKDDQ